MALCPEHPKRDQNPKFTPLSETMSIPVCFIWESPPRANSLLQNVILFLGPDSPNTCSSPCLHRPCYPVTLNIRRSLTSICYLFLLTILQTHPLPGRTLDKGQGSSLFFCNMFQLVALTDRKMKSGMFMWNNLHAEGKRSR